MKFILITAIIFGITAFGLDAFFAHGLRNFLAENYSENAANALFTASRYQLFASLALLTLIIFFRSLPSVWIVVSQGFLIVGVILFSGTIYLKHLLHLPQFSALAPFGGISFMLSLLVLLPLTCAL